MKHVRSWALPALALPVILSLGFVTLGCPGNTTIAQTSNPGGGGTGPEGGTATGATGGTGSTCPVEDEVCDGLDNDCNGTIDDVPNLPGGCICNDGDTQDCYEGEDGTQGIGTCVGGTRTCADGMWGTCEGQVIPGTEQCNQQDDNCDGTADNMGQVTCGIGACSATVETCLNGTLQTCVPGQPTIEVCDGIDNNCNQLTDESDPMLNMKCDTGSQGPCKDGIMQCINLTLVCATNVMPTTEVCDDVDNDCNGVLNDGIVGTGGPCSTGQLGVCGPGTISCSNANGPWEIDCFPDVSASAETCNGLDDNCDGAVDDNNPEGGADCPTGQPGICAQGTLTCQNAAVVCLPKAQAAMETCNGIDDNCNGAIDDGNPGGNQACGCGGAGTTSCVNGALVCNGGPLEAFYDPFANNSKGWTLGTEWAIGPAAASAGCGFGNDPGQDHTTTADNGVAGVNIGACYSTAIHADYYFTSPAINANIIPGQAFLTFYRHLHSDYPPYMNHRVEVSSNNGASWSQVYAVPAGTSQNDVNWTFASFDITAYKSANFRVRFSHAGLQGGIISGGGWNIDDVRVTSTSQPCP